MKEIQIIEIPVEKADDLAKLCIQLRNERYYIAYENEPERHYSILFSNLKWIRKNFGINSNEGSPVTFDSLNAGRRNAIADMKLCLELNVPIWELQYYNRGLKRWKTIQEINAERCSDNLITHAHKPDTLSESGRKQFENNIAKGLLVLCKYVGEVEEIEVFNYHLF